MLTPLLVCHAADPDVSVPPAAAAAPAGKGSPSWAPLASGGGFAGNPAAPVRVAVGATGVPAHHGRSRSPRGTRSRSHSPRQQRAPAAAGAGSPGPKTDVQVKKKKLQFPPEIQTQVDARNAIFASNPELLQRRKAIAQVAFVRCVPGC